MSDLSISLGMIAVAALIAAAIAVIVVVFQRALEPRPSRNATIPATPPERLERHLIAAASLPAPGVRQSNIHSIFLSYRRDDAADITGRLYDRLSHDLGQSTIFKDIDSIPLGSDFRHHIDTSLRDCRVFLLVMGQRWAGNQAGSIERLADPRDFVRLEVETALRRNIPVVPILVHGARMPTENMLPPSLRDIAYRQAIHVRSDPDFHRDVERLTAFLKQQISTPT